MPRHIRTPEKTHAEHSSLLAELVKELKDPRPIGQPIILEDHTPETISRRVHVIWDRWEKCPRESRPNTIAEAYGEAFGAETRKEITLALGVTVPEAAGIGLLPFKVIPARKKNEHPPNQAYLEAMRKAGASVLADSEHPELRFATLEDAEQTLAFLERELKDSKWIVAQEIYPLSD